ncbi:alpha/beta hydrolase [Viridibacillus sp. YIM B01967]|uniref:Alpha/beta hydrolase n=1 Tax=Viridibacillus soli TaxID=2798301 RepID=A0ABS1H581_9BACL|nr:alpha/beta hydrolase [Viridibacillus soli]MBK3494208.1 alpha/beta hydrolase [Viridibacillus soli]
MNNLTNASKEYIANTNKSPKYYHLQPAEVRAARALCPQPKIDLPLLKQKIDRKIPVRDGNEIDVRIYIPNGQGPFPIIIYYHGGGWVFGNLESADAGCHLLAAQANAVVVSVDYRLAPEYKFPTPLHDAFDALLWAYEYATELNGDPNNISVAGDSAGGNLATVVTHIAKAQNGPDITAQVLIYPVTNMDMTTTSYENYAYDLGLDRDGMIWFGEHYVNDLAEYEKNTVSPLLQNNLRYLPKALIIAAEYDVLFDEGVAYAKRLQEAGVPTQHTVMPGLIHSYFSKMEFFEEDTKKTVQLIADFIKS